MPGSPPQMASPGKQLSYTGGNHDETHDSLDLRAAVPGVCAGGHYSRGRAKVGAWRPREPGLGPATVHAELRAVPRGQCKRKERAAAGGDVAEPWYDREHGDQRGVQDAVVQETAFPYRNQGGRGLCAVTGRRFVTRRALLEGSPRRRLPPS